MNATSIAYRDSLEGARLRYAELLTHVSEGSSLSAASRVYTARAGRVWAGAVGIAGAAAMAEMAALRAIGPDHGAISPTLVLLLSWPAMVLAYGAGALNASFQVKRAVVPRLTGDLHTDLAHLEQGGPVEEVRALAKRWPWASTALPMMAMAFLAPLSVHAFVAIIIGSFDKFDKWIQFSLAVVGHAHIALAIFYGVFAARAQRRHELTLIARPSPGPWSIYGWVVLVSAVPGAVFMLLPPILTAVTALFFHFGLYRLMTRKIIEERAALA